MLKQIKSKKIVSQIFSFFIDHGISGPLLTHLWILPMALALMQVKAGFDTRIFNYILGFLSKDGMTSIIYNKYGKTFIEIIALSVS